jgi:cytochrome c biogenesis protein CcdA
MNLSWLWSPVNRRGQILDLLVFLANLFLLGPFGRLLDRLGAGFNANENAAAQQLALIILAAFISYTVGAMLKRAPLHARVKSLPSPGYAGCLFLGWISLHFTLSILGAALIAASFDTGSKGIPVVAMIVLTTLPTFFVARVVFPPKKLEQIPAWRKSWPTELVADLLIVAAVIMLTVMWDIWIADLFTGTWEGQTFGERLFSAGLAVGAFAFFYVSPRFLFLIEDYNRRLTWATLGLTVAPLVGRILLQSPTK